MLYGHCSESILEACISKHTKDIHDVSLWNGSRPNTHACHTMPGPVWQQFQKIYIHKSLDD